jgi:hypothetical protein
MRCADLTVRSWLMQVLANASYLQGIAEQYDGALLSLYYASSSLRLACCLKRAV